MEEGEFIVSKEGFLRKQGGSIKTWKKRWFVLHDADLAYYKRDKNAKTRSMAKGKQQDDTERKTSNPEDELKGRIDLSLASSVRKVKENTKAFLFTITTTRRVYYIAANSQQDRNSWMEKISEVIYRRVPLPQNALTYYEKHEGGASESEEEKPETQSSLNELAEPRPLSILRNSSGSGNDLVIDDVLDKDSESEESEESEEDEEVESEIVQVRRKEEIKEEAKEAKEQNDHESKSNEKEKDSVSQQKSTSEKNSYLPQDPRGTRAWGSMQVGVTINIIEAKNIPVMDLNGLADPYCIIKIGPSTRRTKTIMETLNPTWNESFFILSPQNGLYIIIEIWDYDQLSSDDFIGYVMIPLCSLTIEPKDQWLPICGNKENPIENIKASLHLSVSATKKEVFSPITFYQQISLLPKYQIFIEDNLSIPNQAEQVEFLQDQVSLTIGERIAVGTLYLTTSRLAFIDNFHKHKEGPQTQEEDYVFPMFSKEEDLSSFFSLHKIIGYEKKEDKTIKAREKVYSIIFRCIDFLKFRITFTSGISSEFLESFEIKIQHHIYNSNRFPPSMYVREFFDSQGVKLNWFVFDMEKEMERQRVPLSKWRKSEANKDYQLSASYPSIVYIPATVTDEKLEKVAHYRSKGRFPALIWYNSRKGNSLLRSAQPNVGISGHTSSDDISYFEETNKTSPKPGLIIVDARSKMAAEGNKIRGHGTEDVTIYTNCQIEFCAIGNIHAMRNSVDKLYDTIHSPLTSETNWFGLLQETKWLEHIRLLLASAVRIAYYIEEVGKNVLIHCSDGWDRTSQLSSITQILLDPFYRTFAGFKILIEKEWFAFGHMFKDRIRNPVLPEQRSPIFLQFLDCVWQIYKQFPNEFEFNEKYLLSFADNFDSGWFGEFVFNSEQQRKNHNITDKYISIWSLQRECEEFQNQFYMKQNRILIPICSVRTLQLWAAYYHKYDPIIYTRYTNERQETVVDLPQGERESNPKNRRESNVMSSNADGIVKWVPNEAVNDCTGCSLAFGMFRRKHHCRLCGNIFCSTCLEKRVDLKSLGYPTEQKVCNSCFDIHTKKSIQDD